MGDQSDPELLERLAQCVELYMVTYLVDSREFTVEWTRDGRRGTGRYSENTGEMLLQMTDGSEIRFNAKGQRSSARARYPTGWHGPLTERLIDAGACGLKGIDNVIDIDMRFEVQPEDGKEAIPTILRHMVVRVDAFRTISTLWGSPVLWNFFFKYELQTRDGVHKEIELRVVLPMGISWTS